MQADELKEALRNRKAVLVSSPLYGDIRYARVSAVIYRLNRHGRMRVQAEVEDLCGHSISIVDPKKIRYAEEDTCKKE